MSLRSQVSIAKHGMQMLLSTNYYFTDLLSSGGLMDKEPEQKLVWLCGGILSNIALHPDNRSVDAALTVCFLTMCLLFTVSRAIPIA